MESVVTQKTTDPALKKARTFFLAAAVTLAVIFGVNIFHLLDSALIRATHVSAYAVMTFNAIATVIFAVYIPFLQRFVCKRTNFSPFGRNPQPLPLKSTLIIFGLSALTVFITSACIGFRFKLYYELGLNVAVIQMSAVLVQYVRRLLQLLLAIVVMSLAEQGYRTLAPDGKIPVGGIGFVLLYGIPEFVVQILLSAVFPYVYLIYSLVYAVLFYIGGKRVYTTFIPAAVLLVL